MNPSKKYNGLRHYVYAYWPQFFALYGGVVLALVVIGISAEQAWLSYIPLATAVLLILVFYLVTTLWSAHQLYDTNGINPHHILFDMGQLQARDTFAFVDVGYRRRALTLSSRLTTGRIIILDVYNPQWTTNKALVRLRTRMPKPPSDPRLSFREASVDMIPLPDESIPAVILCQVVSEFWQHGDQLALLQEINRVLAPNGRLLLAERTRSQMNWIIMGPIAFTLKSAQEWKQLMQQAGFIVRRTQGRSGIIHCFRADKPTPAEAHQLALELAFDT